MKLRRIKIFGFKTFADRADFGFDGDVIAVVGPNGCGKSNLVDAILWGLGEPNARALRAANSQDVIFNGSHLRKPLGYAEVSLVFDNEDHRLPLESPEVMVTRRVSRNGDSHYAINRQNCRLRDINDLLADSGLGRQGYAIVGQSEIDQALAASPQQRRAWIDEAAGVQRYRARRVEAQRRLQSAATHLERIADILREIETQREPLRKEAEVARRYREIVGQLQELETDVLATQLAEEKQKSEEAEILLESARERASKEEEEARAQERHAVELTDRLESIEQVIQQLRVRERELHDLASQATTTASIAQSRLESFDKMESNLDEALIEARIQREEAEKELKEATKRDAGERELLARLREELAGSSDDSRNLSQQLHRLETALAEAREAHLEWQKFQAEGAHRKERLAHIHEELSGLKSAWPAIEEGLKEAEAALTEANVQVESARAQLQDLEVKLRQIGEAKRNREKRAAELHQQLAMLEGKRRGLEATIEAHEGLHQGARAVLALMAEGRLGDHYTLVADAMTVGQDLTKAIEIALGGAINDLICPDERAAREAIQILREHRLGRATFQPLSLMRPYLPSEELIRLSRQAGVEGIAADLVRVHGEFFPVIQSLLGRTLIVTDLDSGLQIAKTRGWSKLVSLSGELIHASGAVSGGESVRSSSGHLQRRADLDSVEIEIAQLKRQIADDAHSHATADVQEQKIRDEILELRDRMEELQLDREEKRAWVAGVKQEGQGMEKDERRLRDEMDRLKALDASQPLSVNLAEIEAQRDAVLKQLAEVTATEDRAADRLHDAEVRCQEATKRLADARRRMDSVLASDQSRQRRQETLAEDRKQAIEDGRAAEAELIRLKQLQAEAEKELDGQTRGRATLLEDIQEVQQSVKRAERQAQDALNQMRNAEVERARHSAKRAAIVQRLLEEYGMDEEQALLRAPNVEIPEDAPAVVTRLKREAKSFGEVNLGAIEAYDRLTERYEEMSGQSEDVQQSIDEIEQSMRELDRLTRDRFTEVFSKLQLAFGEVFQSVFGGGEAKLELLDAENILDAGVEIEVTIPGKKRQRLELLSGGERALSAMAFLFSLLRVKPSPLVILDEVDAPLDGRNVERFVKLVREFTDKTQFILITHNVVTIDAADMWFGVTMQEPGVSTLVPCRAPETGKVKEAVIPDAYLKG